MSIIPKASSHDAPRARLGALLVLLWVLALPAQAHPHHEPLAETPSPTTVPGTLAGSFLVGQDGGASYSIPLRVPPGTAGIQPGLALRYDSRAGNGIVGMGWDLDGLSAIERCNASVIQDGFDCGVNDDDHDRFCLDGERLVNTVPGASDGICHDDSDDPYYQPGAIYHTEKESWRRIESIDSVDGVGCGNGPCAFVVTDRRGWTWEYGAPDDTSPDPYGARVLVADATGDSDGTVRRWALNQVTDLYGNSLTISHTQAPLGSDGGSSDGPYQPCAEGSSGDPAGPDYDPTASEESYPCRIDYTSNGSASNGSGQALRQVLFGYQPRPDDDVLLRYVANGEVETSARLVEVVSSVADGAGGSTTVFDYQLCYDDDSSQDDTTRATSRSRLASVTQCGLDSTCFPATTFGYDDTTPDLEPYSADPLTLADCSSSTVSWADVDGDGRIDWICEGSGNVTVQLGADASTDGDWSASAFTMSAGDCEGQVSWFDFDGDGRDDWLCFETIGTDSGAILIYTTEPDGDGGWALAAVIEDPMNTACGATPLWTDFNSDGKIDWICGNDDGTYVLLSTGSDLEAPSSADSNGEIFLDDASIVCDQQLDWIDFDGDGAVDWTCNNTDNGGLWVLLSTGAGLADVTFLGEDTLDDGGAAVCDVASGDQVVDWIDFNGDRLNDWACSDIAANGEITVLLSTGRDLVAAPASGSWSTTPPVCNQANGSQLVWTDINGDAMDDPLCWSPDDGDVEAMVSTGTDLVALGNGTLGSAMECNVENGGPAWQDFTGQGLSQWICADPNADTVAIEVPSYSFPDLMTSITNGLGGVVSITYQPLSNPEVYTQGSDPSATEAQRLVNDQANASYPVAGFESALYVVASYDRSDGQGNTYSYSQSYSGALYDFEGRGWLGFETATLEDPQLGNQQVTRYLQTFPWDGLVASVELRCLDGSDDPSCDISETRCSDGSSPEAPGGDAVLHRTTVSYACSDCDVSSECWNDSSAQDDGSYATAYPTFEPFACVYQPLPADRRTDLYTYGCRDLSLGNTSTYDVDGATLVEIPLANDTTQSAGLGTLTQWVDLDTVDAQGNDLDPSDNVYRSFTYYSLIDHHEWLVAFPTEQVVSSDAAGDDVLKQTRINYDYPESSASDGCVPESWTDFGGTMGVICRQHWVDYQQWDDDSASCQVSDSDPIWLATTATFDAYGNRVTHTDPAGNTTTTTYDDTYQTFPATTEWANGLTASYDYDAGFGTLTSQTDVNQNTFAFAYDALGRRASDSGPGEDGTGTSVLTTYTWGSDSSGTTLETDRSTDWDDPSEVLWSRTSFDGLGRPYLWVGEGPESSGSESSRVRKRSYTTPKLLATETLTFYCNGTGCADPIDDATGCGSAEYPYVAHTYDAYGRFSSMQVPFGSGDDFACTESTWVYDDSLTTTRNLAVNTSEATSQTLQYDYFDAQRRMVWSATPYASDTTASDPTTCSADGACSVTTFAYDLQGRASVVTDPNGNTTSSCWDSLDRAQATVVSNAYDFFYTWDSPTLGLLGQRTDAAGQTLAYTYDSLDRTTTKTSTDAQGTKTQTVTYTWDATHSGATNANGRLASVDVESSSNDQEVTYGFDYDPYGRPTSASVDLAADLWPDGVARSYTFGASYDPMGRPSQVDNPDGSSIQHCWDAAGRPSRLALFDAGSTTVDCSEALHDTDTASASFPSYNALDQPLEIDFANGVSTTYTFDALGQMATQVVASPSATLLQNVLVWDSLSQVTSITDCNATDNRQDSACAGMTASESDTDDSQSFRFDQQRLVAAAGSYGEMSYAYDVGGRLTSKDGVDYVDDVDPDSGLPILCGLDTAADTCPAAGDASLVYYGSYDSQGNLVEATADTSTWKYTFDPEYRLTQAVEGSSDDDSKTQSLTSQSVYDHRGRRIQKLDGWGDTTVYVAPGYEVTVPADGSTVTTAYLVVPGGRLAAVTSDGDGTGGDTLDSATSGDASGSADGVPQVGTLYFHRDHLGSTSVVTDGDGDEASRVAYLPYGEPTVSPDDSDDYRPKFNGKELDEDTVLYDFGPRFYDPQRGRFLSADTRLGGPTASTQDAWNRYGFALGNPVTHSDPSGHSVGSWFKHAAHDVKHWTKRHWKSALLTAAMMGADVAVDALTDGAATPELVAADEEVLAVEASETAETSVADASGDCETAAASFGPGTAIATEDGPAAIETIEVGQRVWAWNEASEDLELRTVLRTITRHAQELVELDLQTWSDDGESGRSVAETLVTTAEHPFWVEGRGWLAAGKLQVGDGLISLTGEQVLVTGWRRLAREGTVFNLSVARAETYFVGRSGVLAHNLSCLEARDMANRIHDAGVSNPAYRDRTVTAVARLTGDDGSIDVVATNNYRYSPDQRDLIQNLGLGRLEGDVIVPGTIHAEMAIDNFAASNGYTIESMGISREICAACGDTLQNSDTVTNATRIRAANGTHDGEYLSRWIFPRSAGLRTWIAP